MINNAFDANTVIKPLFGKSVTTKSIVSRSGSNFGSPKAIRSGSCQRSLATVRQSSSESKTTGLSNRPQNDRITQAISILFTTAPTSTKMAALSVL